MQDMAPNCYMLCFCSHSSLGLLSLICFCIVQGRSQEKLTVLTRETKVSEADPSSSVLCEERGFCRAPEVKSISELSSGTLCLLSRRLISKSRPLSKVWMHPRVQAGVKSESQRLKWPYHPEGRIFIANFLHIVSVCLLECKINQVFLRFLSNLTQYGKDYMFTLHRVSC